MTKEVPIRIQRKRVKGWKMPQNTVYVGRPTKWGNPMSVGFYRGYTAEDAVRDYQKFINRLMEVRSFENVFGKPPTVKEIKKELRGKNLACFCPLGKPCHADILLKIANKK